MDPLDEIFLLRVTGKILERKDGKGLDDMSVSGREIKGEQCGANQYCQEDRGGDEGPAACEVPPKADPSSDGP